MSSIISADFYRLYLTPFYSLPMRFAGTPAGTFYAELRWPQKQVLRLAIKGLNWYHQPSVCRLQPIRKIQTFIMAQEKTISAAQTDCTSEDERIGEREKRLTGGRNQGQAIAMRRAARGAQPAT
jgi:hypothetical protein